MDIENMYRQNLLSPLFKDSGIPDILRLSGRLSIGFRFIFIITQSIYHNILTTETRSC